MTLTSTGGPLERGASPGNTADLRYEGRNAGVYMGIWKPPAWRRFLTTRVGHIA
jgi:hypothetical protein